MLISGKQIRAWRKTTGLEQKEVAQKLGISNSTLCRIEKEDRPITGKILELIPSLMSLDVKSDSVLALAASQLATAEAFESKREKERLRIERLKNLKDVSTLTDIGNTYRYRDFIVVPSQYYARWSGQETYRVNETIFRIAEQGRLEIGEHFFKLTFEETRDFIKSAPVGLDANELKFGLVLITFSAVNRLTHHFRDPISVAQSNHINDTYTCSEESDKPKSFTEVIATVDNPYEKFALLSDMCKKISEYHLVAMRTSEQYQVLATKQTETELIVEANKVELDTKIEATDAKIDAHKVEIETRIEATQEGLVSKIDVSNGNLSITPDQQLLFTPYFQKLKPSYGHISVLGICKRAIKKQFVSPRTDGSWYHLRQRDLDDALEFTKRWKPTVAEMETINYKIRQDGSSKKVTKICPKCGSLGVHKFVVPKIPFPFWKCDKCTWNVACVVKKAKLCLV